MRINIDGLTEAELVDLNNRIVERLRFLHQARSHKRMLDFKIGDRVSFQPEGLGIVVGILTRCNKKTVTVITEAGERWNVVPNLCIESSNPPAHERQIRISFPCARNEHLMLPNNAIDSDTVSSQLRAPHGARHYER